MELAAIVGVGVLVVLGFALVIGLSAVLNGWALSILWGWFMVPLGLPVLGVVPAIGVAMVVSFLTHHYHREPDDDKEGAALRALWRLLGVILLRPFLALLFGWIVKQFL